MSVTTIKAEKVVALALGLLTREMSLGALVWRDGLGDFSGYKGDTVTIKVPAYAVANERALRSGDARTKSSLAENKIAIKLTDDLYLDVPISDEELSLDIADFGAQVVRPVTDAIARKVEDKLAILLGSPKDGMGQALVYHTTLAHAVGTDKPYDTVVDARTALNNAQVPFGNRFIVTGSDLEADILKSDQFVRADASGQTETLREAKIGRIAGFDVYTSQALAPDEAYACHKSAVALANRAPVVPAGAPWGASGNYNGVSIRTVRVFDPNEVEDRFVADSWMGAGMVTDPGHFDANGKFVPSAVELASNDLEVAGATPTPDADDAFRLVRAVKIAVS